LFLELLAHRQDHQRVVQEGGLYSWVLGGRPEHDHEESPAGGGDRRKESSSVNVLG